MHRWLFILIRVQRLEEDELICKLIHKRCPDITALDYMGKMKLFSYLYQKGFERESIERVFRREEEKARV